MSTRHGREKPAFIANENNLGGSHQILADYINMQRVLQAYTNAPSMGQLVHYPNMPKHPSMAQRLSYNKARRRAAVDLTAVNHISNIYNMHRRIEESYSATERKKNEWDVSVHPVYQKRSQAFTKSLLRTEVELWEQELRNQGKGSAALFTSGLRRPLSAPTSRSAAGGGGGGVDVRGDGYAGFSVRHSLHDAFPSGRYQDAVRTADHEIYKKAIMQEVVDCRLYKERDLQRLFRQYIRLAPLRDKDLVERVVAELKQDLDVR